MEVKNLTLTEEDRRILHSYEIFLDGLAEYLGDGYEIVLHSLENLDHSVIKIVNGQHTGRQVGAPITDLALQMLAHIQDHDGSSSVAYFTKNKRGEPLKASTICVRGENDRIIGLVCMNFYLNTPLSDVLGVLVQQKQFGTPSVAENFSESTEELVKKAVEQVRREVQADASVLPSLKNREIVRQLYQQGIFNIKSAVEQVAGAMEISQNTVYLHLRVCRDGVKTRKNGPRTARRTE